MPTLQDNQQFDRYLINRWLGNGVSGESYEATDIILQRKVTLKLIHPWTSLPESARRQFFREMQGISQLHHPYLASVLDYGELDKRLYIVRRYNGNGSLLSPEGRLWYQPPLQVADAIHFAIQLAQALSYIHQQGYLHGSLTFSNLLVLRTSNFEHEADFAPFLLSDLGLTNFVRRFGQPTHSFFPLTMAPEQFGQRVTPASDQYALAIILFFWLSGRPAFIGTPSEIEHLKLTERITPLTSLNSSITIAQEQVLRRALAVYPEERYPSMTAFADALTTTLAPISPVETSDVSAFEPVSQPAAPSASEFPFIPATDQPVSLQEFESIPATDPMPPFDQVPNPEPLPSPAPDPLPVPAPVPAPTPEPLPQPTPDPLPQPAPDPLPQPAPEPLPEPLPETLPQPAPDVFIPRPETEPTPLPAPQTDFSNDIALSTQHQDVPEQQLSTQPHVVIRLPGTQNTYTFVLEREEITIGRAGDSDILLEEDPLASRHHALLRHQDNHFLLYDLRSASGVFVNGQQLFVEQGFRLNDGNVISIGNYELIFHQPSPVTA